MLIEFLRDFLRAANDVVLAGSHDTASWGTLSVGLFVDRAELILQHTR